MTSSRTSVVVITRNRRDELMANVRRLVDLPERPPVIIVDNGSEDGSADAVASAYPDVTVIAAGGNMGAAGRNLGVARATTPYVAFADDDSWWEPHALDRAADLLDAHRRVALLAARIIVAPEGTTDPTSREMQASPLPTGGDLPGPRVLGFVACGAIVRRIPFLGVGGFDELFGVGGEENLLATDLETSGWALCYASDVVAVHEPSPSRDRGDRQRRIARNDLWYAWLRRRFRSAARKTFSAAGQARNPTARAGFAMAVARIPTIVRRRRPVPAYLDRELALLDAANDGSTR